MAVHIKDIIELVDCVKQARKILSGLSEDAVVPVSDIQRFQIKADRLLTEINNEEEKDE